MFLLKYIKNNKALIFKNLSIIVWSDSIVNGLEKRVTDQRIRFLRKLYAFVIVFISLSSFLTFINPNDNFRTAFNAVIAITQVVSFFVFLFDYASHWVTFYTRKNTQNWSRIKTLLRYPISFPGIVILICLLSSLNVLQILNNSIEIPPYLNFFKSLNFAKIFRILFCLKLIAGIAYIFDAFKEQKKVLLYLFWLSIIFILLFGLVILNNEVQELNLVQMNWLKENNIDPSDTAKYLNDPSYKALSNGYITNFFDAIYFMTITLTTIGYGDLTPHSPVSKFVVMLAAILGVAIIAIPSGVIAGSFLNLLQSHFKDKKKEKQEAKKQALKDKEALEAKATKAEKNTEKTHLDENNLWLS